MYVNLISCIRIEDYLLIKLIQSYIKKFVERKKIWCTRRLSQQDGGDQEGFVSASQKSETRQEESLFQDLKASY